MGIQAETITHKNHEIAIEYDDSPENPREWDNICEIHHWHSRCNLGDIRHTSTESVEEILAKAKRQGDIVMALHCYEHGGITISLNSFAGRLPQGHYEFDSGQVGFVVIRRKKMLEEFNKKTFTAKLKKRAREIAEAEVETFNAYLNGNVYGYIVDYDGDSCWGFYSIKDAIEEAKSMIDYIVKQERKNHFEQLKIWIRNKVPFQYRISAI